MLTTQVGVSAAHAESPLFQRGRPCLRHEWELVQPTLAVYFSGRSSMPATQVGVSAAHADIVRFHGGPQGLPPKWELARPMLAVHIHEVYMCVCSKA